jgi:hypothetical protein
MQYREMREIRYSFMGQGRCHYFLLPAYNPALRPIIRCCSGVEALELGGILIEIGFFKSKNGRPEFKVSPQGLKWAKYELLTRYVLGTVAF